MYIIIVGCGRVGSELGKILSRAGHDVVIIDKNQQSFRRLGETFNGLTLCGDGRKTEFLKTCGIEKAGVFCALTNGDNTNLMAAQVAKNIFKVPKVFARVYDPQRAETFRMFGVDTISGTRLIAAMIRDKIIESRFSSYLIETGELGVLKFERKNDLVGKKVMELNVPAELNIVTILRQGRAILPQPDTVVEKEDVLYGLVRVESLEKIKNKFQI